MDLDKYKKLIKWIVILPVVGILLMAVVTSAIFINFEQVNYEKNLKKIEQQAFQNAKRSSKEKVNEIIKFIEANTNILKQDAKNESKRMIDFAYLTMEKIYQENKNLPKQQILELIYQKLREMRFFDNLDGYYFIYDMNGVNLMHPSLPSLEGKNLINMKDANGKKLIKEGVENLQKFSAIENEWLWVRKKGEKAQRKFGYMRVFRELDIFVGTGRYESDIFENIKKETQKLLINYQYGDKGYICAFDYDGNVISHIKKDIIGTNRWNVSSRGRYIVQDAIKGTKKSADGFFMTYYATVDPVTKKSAKKTSYSKDLSEFGWIVGTGVYMDDIKKDIKKKREELKKELNKTLYFIGFAIVFMLIFILIPTLFIFLNLKRALDKNQNELVNLNTQTLEEKKLLAHKLRFDSLTNLPNRIFLAERLEEATKRAKRGNKILAVIFVDLDDFKEINDTLGHTAGDLLLQEIAQRLQRNIRNTDIVARLAGDEFVIVIDGCESKKEIENIAIKLQSKLCLPMMLEKTNISMTASLGIAIYFEDAHSADELITNADRAMYKSKHKGKNKYSFFS